MAFDHIFRLSILGCVVAATAGCGGGGIFSRPVSDNPNVPQERVETSAGEVRQSTLADLFTNVDDPNTTVEVNKYLWQASLEILNFLPIQSVDPFSGVITTGFGTPPGGGRAYRATVFVQDPALDARSLKLALVSRGGPVSSDTVRAVEDAILTRARQLRIRDSNL